MTLGGTVDWSSRMQKWTSKFVSNADYNAFRLGCMRLTQILHLLTKLGIPTIPEVCPNSHSVITSIKNRIYRGSKVAHIVTRYYHAADKAADGELHLSNVPTAEMLADCNTKQLLKPTIVVQHAAMGMIRMGLWIALEIASVHWEMVAGMISEQEMPSLIPSGSNVIG